jgi:uncharacterized surface anchored protein
MREKWLRLVSVAALVTTFASAQNTGRITGSVLDENGQRIYDATICTSVASGTSHSINCRDFTDKDGRFLIENLPLGKYGLFAINEAQGYSIQNQSPGQEITVSAANSSPDLTIHLSPRGGVLSGTVRDKVSGVSVKGVSISYLDVDGKASGGTPLHSDGEFNVTLPTQCDLVIVIFAKGYKGWVYTDPSNPSRPVLRLAVGERKVVAVELEPNSQP